MAKHSNRIKKTSGDIVMDVVIYILLTLLALICLYPLYQVVVDSFSDPNIVMKKNGLLFKIEGFQVDAYKMVFSNKNIATGFKNSLFYIVVGTGLQFLTTVTAAYVLSKKDAMLKKPIMIFFAITMYFGGGLIPSFLLVNKMGLMDTCWAILLPGACNVWNIIIMRTQFVNIPDGLKEVATIDGASDVTILFRILIPLSGAVIAVLVLFSAVGYWNMWYEPMIYLTKRSQYPIQSVLREILIDSNAQMMAGAGKTQIKLSNTKDPAIQTLVKYANIIVCTIPILVVYPFAQKYFVKGVMVGSLKG